MPLDWLPVTKNASEHSSSPKIPGGLLSREELARLARQIAEERPAELRWMKAAVLASFTTDFLKPYLIVESARRGIGLDLWLGPYGQIEQQALDAGSALHAEQPDVVLILPRLEDLAPELGHRFVAQSAPASAVPERLAAAVRAIRASSKAKILLGNFPPPARLAAGIADSSLETSQTAFVQRLNDEIASRCRSVADASVLDVARIACTAGLERWEDRRMAYLAKAPLSADAMRAIAAGFARHLRALLTAPKKCLVLDCDNTIWGGVVGEAGLEGIQLGADYPGNVFVDFQKRILALRDCGILIAVASKNNPADVLEVLDRHPACLLKREHFAAFEVHWEDKAASLRRIASQLGIGIDSLVFFDDNPAEREWVAGQLPQVTVIDVPESPMGFEEALMSPGCFDIPVLTGEDRRRAEIYQQEAQRQQLSAQAGSLEDFLRSLEMRLTAGLADETTMPRIVQLLAKTNQLNLTTRRHDAAAISKMISDGGICLWAKVQDKFGDSGMVGVVIAVPEAGPAWRIDTLLLSCRVIGRNVETAMLAILERLLAAKGAGQLIGEYFPTKKNQPAAGLLERHGFAPMDGHPGRWLLKLDVPRPLPDEIAFDGLFPTA